MTIITKETILGAVTTTNKEPDFSVAPLSTILRHFENGLESIEYGQESAVFRFADGTQKAIDAGLLLIDFLASNQNSLPLESLENGVIRRYYFQTLAIIPKSFEKAVTNTRAAVNKVISAKGQLRNDIAKTFKAKHDELAAQAKMYLEQITKLTPDLLDVYFKTVEDNKPLVIEYVEIDASNTRIAIAKETLAEKIAQVKDLFDPSSIVVVEPSKDLKSLDVMVQNFDSASKEDINKQLHSVFGEKSTKWQVIEQFRTAIINIKLPA